MDHEEYHNLLPFGERRWAAHGRPLLEDGPDVMEELLEEAQTLDNQSAGPGRLLERRRRPEDYILLEAEELRRLALEKHQFLHQLRLRKKFLLSAMEDHLGLN